MTALVAELIGTALLVLLGNGVVANVLLSKTKGHGSGWLVITTGWALAVFVAVACTEQFSGAHLNPAVTFGVAAAGKFEWDLVAGYIAAQMAGGFLGAAIMYFFYQQHFRETDDADAKLATFCNAPAIRSVPSNMFGEIIGTFVLVFAVLAFAAPTVEAQESGATGLIGLGSIGALPVALVVFSVGISLGGTTGYAINPARDFSPRVAHAVLPIPGKRDSDWSYSWIPVAGPILGGLLAAAVYMTSGAGADTVAVP